MSILQIFKSFAPFTDFMNEVSNIKVDNAKDVDAVMLLYNLMECRDIYLKI